MQETALKGTSGKLRECSCKIDITWFVDCRCVSIPRNICRDDETYLFSPDLLCALNSLHGKNMTSKKHQPTFVRI